MLGRGSVELLFLLKDATVSSRLLSPTSRNGDLDKVQTAKKMGMNMGQVTLPHSKDAGAGSMGREVTGCAYVFPKHITSLSAQSWTASTIGDQTCLTAWESLFSSTLTHSILHLLKASVGMSQAQRFTFGEER